MSGVKASDNSTTVGLRVGYRARITFNGIKYCRPTLHGPNAEEQAAREYEVIEAHKAPILEQLKAITDSDEKRWRVQDYWWGLLGEEPPPRRTVPPRTPCVRRPEAEGEVRTLREPKLKVKERVKVTLGLK